jgi:hypothetical protein
MVINHMESTTYLLDDLTFTIKIVRTEQRMANEATGANQLKLIEGTKCKKNS